MNNLEEFDKLCEEERNNAKPCSWCDMENNVDRKTDVSHKICDRHANELLISAYERLASKWGYMI